MVVDGVWVYWLSLNTSEFIGRFMSDTAVNGTDAQVS